VIERRERCVNQEEAIGRELTLVAQEIKLSKNPITTTMRNNAKAIMSPIFMMVEF